jgi:hypothetical protein
MPLLLGIDAVDKAIRRRAIARVHASAPRLPEPAGP